MNVLIASYSCIDNNSGYQIVELAKGLRDHGVGVSIAVPKLLNAGSPNHSDGIPILHFADVLSGRAEIPKVDILHAWTPRENVRRFVTSYLLHHSAWLVVHLEDNEDIIRDRFLDDLEQSTIPSGLSCPLASRWLLEVADGVTVIAPALLEFVPPGKPATSLLPIIDFSFFSEPSQLVKTSLHANGQFTVGYFGNVSAVNFEDFQMLCEAIRLLNREGHLTVLLKTGTICPTLRSEFQAGEDLPLRDLGFVARDQIPSLLAEADVCVQPGNTDDFNSYRLPSKIPEILAVGTPLITGICNLGQTLKDRKAAVVIDHMTPRNLADAILQIRSDAAAAQEVSNRGVTLARNLFSSEAISNDLLQFYKSLPKGRTLEQTALFNTAAQSLINKLERETPDPVAEGLV